MLLVYVVTLILLAYPVAPAPTTIAPSTPSEGQDLETSETGHFRRKRIWKKIAKQLSSGLGGYGLGGYGLGGGLGGFPLAGLGVDFLLSELGNYQKHHHSHHNHHGSHGYGAVGSHGAGHYSPAHGTPYTGYAPGFSHTPVHALGIDHVPSLGHLQPLGLWDAPLDVDVHGYGWGTHGGLDFGDFWI